MVKRARAGKFRPIFITVHPGYISIERRSQRIDIPRRELITLLRWLIPQVKHSMPGPSFDPERAMRDYLREEEATAKEIKRQKRELSGF